MTFEEAVDKIVNIPRFGAKHSVEDTAKFLDFAGLSAPKARVIHVAGTNGKGSVCNYLKEILEAHGKKVCLFTSPHLVDIRERFYITDTEISKEMFLKSYDYVAQKIDEYNPESYYPSFFEYIFFMGMRMFESECPDADFIILETGLGGRLDATNSLPVKELCVITQIGLDHTEYLGDTVEKIAFEKAGIIKPGAAVIYREDALTSRVFEEKAAECGAKTIIAGSENEACVVYKDKEIVLSIKGIKNVTSDIILNTTAKFQVQNAVEAYLSAEYLLSYELDENAVRSGFLKALWPARMQEIAPDVYLDGAHNPCGIKAFLESVKKDSPAVLLFSAVADKDVISGAELICDSKAFKKIIITQMPGARAMSAERIKEIFEGCAGHPRITVEKDIELAYKLAREGGMRTYIAGSLYLAGYILQLLG